MRAVTGAAAEGGGVPHGAGLLGLAESTLGSDEDALSQSRDAVLRALGPAALVDAAAVIGLFNAIDRVADATGIPLEPGRRAASIELRAGLGLDRFADRG